MNAHDIAGCTETTRECKRDAGHRAYLETERSGPEHWSGPKHRGLAASSTAKFSRLRAGSLLTGEECFCGGGAPR